MLAFPLQELERLVWVCPVWEVLLHKLPELVSGACPPTRIACTNGSVNLGAELLSSPDLAVKCMMEARLAELEWSTPSTPGNELEGEKQRMVEQLALSLLQTRLVEARRSTPDAAPLSPNPHHPPRPHHPHRHHPHPNSHPNPHSPFTLAPTLALALAFSLDPRPPPRQAFRKESQTEDADRMAQQLIDEEEESKTKRQGQASARAHSASRP